jgi:hypothetical protein
MTRTTYYIKIWINCMMRKLSSTSSLLLIFPDFVRPMSTKANRSDKKRNKRYINRRRQLLLVLIDIIRGHLLDIFSYKNNNKLQISWRYPSVHNRITFIRWQIYHKKKIDETNKIGQLIAIYSSIHHVCILKRKYFVWR